VQKKNKGKKKNICKGPCRRKNLKPGGKERLAGKWTHELGDTDPVKPLARARSGKHSKGIKRQKKRKYHSGKRGNCLSFGKKELRITHGGFVGISLHGQFTHILAPRPPVGSVSPYRGRWALFLCRNSTKGASAGTSGSMLSCSPIPRPLGVRPEQ